MVSQFVPLLCCSFALLLGAALASSPEAKSRDKRTVTIPSKHTVDDLVLELAKKHLIKMILEQQTDLAKIQHSLATLQRDSCTNIKSVGWPVTHNTRRYTQGAWMKDPLGIMGDKIFVMESYVNRKVLEEYENIFKFKAGIVHKKHTLPYNYDGTGAVVYGPYLYYNRGNSPYIVKYNILTSKQEALINLGSVGFQQRKNYYQWTGYTGMDLAVDEQGLWALWGDTDNARRLYASKIDVYSNAIIHTRALTTEKMNLMGNAFVACGVVYCIDSYNARSTTINFAYDFKTGRTWNPNIQFTNQYGYNSMVDYNPRERVLYAWDNKRLVTYPITFEPHK